MSLDLRLLCVGLLGAAFLSRLIAVLLRPPRRPLPPGPKPFPLIGNLHQVPKSLQWLHLYDWSKKYGPVMHLNMAGKPLVILSTHKAAHDLLNRRSSQYSHRPQMVMAGNLVTQGMHMLLRPYDDRYKLHQRMQGPLLTPASASRYRLIQDRESRQLIFDILENVDKTGDEEVDLHHHFERAMASTIYYLIYGYRLKTGYEEELLSAKHVMAEFARIGQVGAYLVDSVPALNYLPGFLAPWKKEAAELFELERQLHEENLKKGLANAGRNFTKYMRASPEADGMPDVELAFNLGILADAALDTSTVALDWFIVAWITSGSRWVGKAQQILDKVVGKDRLPAFEDREDLSYIVAIVNETLRWRPVVVGGVPHFTKVEDEYMGYRIPANSTVMPNAFAITRDRSVFGEEVDAFLPERWLADVPQGDEPSVGVNGFDKTAVKDLPQTGFGYGRRICSGRHIAHNQLFIQVARMLWAFDIEAGVDAATGLRHKVDDMDCTEGFVTLPKPFKVVMRPRGDWVYRIVGELGTTHGVDHVEMLDLAVKGHG